ncbi:MAG: hypothetical protein AB1757_23945 [Acidobacteriota bacterium]
MQLKRIVALAVVALLIGATAAMAQNKFSGKYKGVAKSDAMGDLPIEVNLVNTNGKLSGSIDTAQGSAAITGGSIADDGKFTMTFDAGGTEGKVEGMIKDGVVTGKWDLGGVGGSLEAKTEGAGTPAAPAAPTAGGAPALSGDWAGEADVMGQAMPFTLKLTQDGAALKGESTSDQGSVPLSNGKVEGNKISFTLDSPQGAIVLTGVVVGDKIDGEYDFAGQMKGKWKATKKK